MTEIRCTMTETRRTIQPPRRAPVWAGVGRRMFPHFDAFHPDHVSGSVKAPSIHQLAHLRRRVVVADPSTWDWTGDGSCSDPYWDYHSALRQRRMVRAN